MEFKIGYHYRILKKIGHGTFGSIYLGSDEKRSIFFLLGSLCIERNVAIKVESAAIRYPQLAYEARVYRYLGDGIGIPRAYYFGREDAYNVLVMDLVGPSLEDLLHYCNGTFSLKTVCMLAQEMLLRIQFLHERNVIHRDIKPNNFLIGLDKLSNVIYLIDYGLCKHYRNPLTREHIS